MHMALKESTATLTYVDALLDSKGAPSMYMVKSGELVDNELLLCKDSFELCTIIPKH